MAVGQVIVIEGLTGAGKSIIFDRLKSIYPQFDFFGEVATSLAKQGCKLGDQTEDKTEQILIDRYIELSRQVSKSKSQGKICILDRNHISKLTYDYVHGISVGNFSRLIEALSAFEQCVRPDCYIQLKIDSVVAHNRIAAKDVNLRTNYTIKKLRLLQDSYIPIFLFKEKHIPIIVDTTTLSISDVLSEVKDIIDQFLQKENKVYSNKVQRKRLYHWCTICKQIVARKITERFGFPINCRHNESEWKRIYLGDY